MVWVEDTCKCGISTCPPLLAPSLPHPTPLPLALLAAFPADEQRRFCNPISYRPQHIIETDSSNSLLGFSFMSCDSSASHSGPEAPTMSLLGLRFSSRVRLHPFYFGILVCSLFPPSLPSSLLLSLFLFLFLSLFLSFQSDRFHRSICISDLGSLDITHAYHALGLTLTGRRAQPSLTERIFLSFSLSHVFAVPCTLFDICSRAH